MKTEHFNWLESNHACKESISWVQRNNIQSLEEAWYVCERGDWLLWMAEHLGADRRKLVMCATLCAHTVVQYMQDPRSRDAVRIMFLWGRGKVTDEQVVAARDAANNAIYTAVDWDARAAYRSDAIVRSNAAARSAVTTRSDAAAWAAVAEGWSTDGATATKANQMRTASIARKMLTEEVMNAIQTIH